MKAPAIHRARRKTSASRLAFFGRSASTASFFSAQAEAAPQRSDNTCTRESWTEGGKPYSVAEGNPSGPVRAEMAVLAGIGEPLPAPVRRFFEAKLSTELGSVRVHHGSEASASAEARHAQAYAAGNEIVFNAGQYDPYSDAGRRLLSHELAHVVQQRENPQSFGQVRCMQKDGAPEAHAEKENPAAPTSSGQEPAAPGGASPAKQEKAATVQDEKAATSQEEKLAAPMPLPNFSVFGKPGFHSDFAQNVTFSGRTDAMFDGGKGHTENLKSTPATDCQGCGGECITATGSLVINYHVSTTVALPEVPAGLTPCQEKRVRDTVNNVLKPHEDKHVAAFQSYNGAVTLPINYTGCREGLQAHVQSMIDAHAAAREAAAKTKSAALDPFVVHVDLDCDEPPKK
jgi:Domain of unknown function (DUF4157)